MTDNTADQHDPDQGGIVPPHILDKLTGGTPPFSARRDPFYRRDKLAEWISRWTEANPFESVEEFDSYLVKLAEALISAGWITPVAPRE